MSVISIKSAIIFWPPWVMPNSAACFSAFWVSPPALASPITLALEACACSRKDEKSDEFSGRADVAEHLPPFSLTTLAASRSSADAERIVGGDEEPGVLAAFDHRLAGTLESA